MQGIIPGAPGKQLKAWAYYSTILREEEQKFGSDGSRIGKGEIGGYFTMDLNLRYENLFAPGVTVGLKVVNLLDRKYYHPGIREANSGDPEHVCRRSIGNWLEWEGLERKQRLVQFEVAFVIDRILIYCFGDHNDKYTCNRQL